MIYQLAKTTPSLTGQVKVNLIADPFQNDSRITISELHVSPISDSIYYTISDDDINRSHNDNIKILYKKIEGDFYNPTSNAVGLEGKYLYIGDNDETIDTTFMMGTRRSKVNRYGKTFEYLMPLYVDDWNDVATKDGKCRLKFEFVVKSTAGKEILRENVTVANDVLKYITDYFKNVDKDMMFISYSTGKSTIHGIRVDTGVETTVDLNTLVTDLISNERTMIEFDNLILRNFESSKMIARQMINLCFHFNIDDIIIKEYRNSMLFDNFNVYVECLRLGDDGKYSIVETRDIYSNYEKIDAYRIDLQNFIGYDYDKDINVFGYLKDDRCVDLMYTNKIIQENIHFSYNDNDRIMFNLYNGFSPYISDLSGTTQIMGTYNNQPNVTEYKYDKYKRNASFIAFNDETKSFLGDSFENVAIHLNGYDTTSFDYDEDGVIWRNGLRYDNDVIFDKKKSQNFTLSAVANSPLAVSKSAVMKTRASADENSEKSVDIRKLRVNSVAMKSNKTALYVVLLYNKTDPNDNYISIVSTGSNITPLTWKSLRGLFNSDFRTVFNPLVDGETYNEYDEMWEALNSRFDEDTYELYIFKNVDCVEVGYRAPIPQNKRIILDNSSEINAIIYELFSLFKRVLSGLVEPNEIRLNSSIAPMKVKIPKYAAFQKSASILTREDIEARATQSTSPIPAVISKIKTTDEIRYVKTNDSTTLYRYDGGILPQFISLSEDYPYYNFIYRKRNLSELDNDELDMFNFYESNDVEPDYKSIGYYTLESKRMTESYPFDDKDSLFEVKYLKDNSLCFNEREFVIKTNSYEMNQRYGDADNPRYILDDSVVYSLFYDYVKSYNPDLSDEVISNKLYPLYGYDFDWEYMYKIFDSLDKTNKYNYTIRYKVKI